MEIEGSLWCSQQLANCPNAKPDESSSQSSIASILIFSFHLCLGFHSYTSILLVFVLKLCIKGKKGKAIAVTGNGDP
jgi:hypothetical protein